MLHTVCRKTFAILCIVLFWNYKQVAIGYTVYTVCRTKDDTPSALVKKRFINAFSVKIADFDIRIHWNTCLLCEAFAQQAQGFCIVR